MNVENTLNNFNERLKLLEETVVNLIKNSDTEPKTIYGTHSFLDCPEQDSKRTEDFYNK